MNISEEDKELLSVIDNYEKACEVANKQAERAFAKASRLLFPSYFLQRPDDYPDKWPEKSGYYRARLINLLRTLHREHGDLL